MSMTPDEDLENAKAICSNLGLPKPKSPVEKIHDRYCACKKKAREECMKFIAAQIEEAVKESHEYCDTKVYEHGNKQFERGCKEGFKDGFHAAREKAAEIAEKLNGWNGEPIVKKIVDRIRAMEEGE